MTMNYSIDVDGTTLQLEDCIVDGRTIREAAMLTPSSSYVLIRIDKGLAQSVGLEEELRLERGERPIFRSFETDHINTFTVEERGWEWGSDEIGENDIRVIAQIPVDRELYLHSDEDRKIARDGYVRLSGDGVEHIRTREAKPQLITIRVNSRKREVEPGELSFEELLRLAFENPPNGPQVSFTVSYRKGPKSRPEGSILAGQSVQIVKGMVFHVTATDKS